MHCAVALALLVVAVSSTVRAEPFTETVCTDSACNQNCVPTMLSTGVCYGTSVAGTSVVVQCKAGGAIVEQIIYSDSEVCGGFSHTMDLAPGECGEVVGSDGAKYIMFQCGAESAKEAEKKFPVTQSKKHFTRVAVNVTVDLMLSVPKDAATRAALSMVPGIHRDRSRHTVFAPAALLAALTGGKHHVEGEVSVISDTAVEAVLLKKDDFTLDHKGLLIKESALSKALRASSRQTSQQVTVLVAGAPVVTFVMRR